MAPVSVVISHIFLMFAAAVIAQQSERSPNLIGLGSSLSSNIQPASWLSPSGVFAFGFYPRRNSFAVGIWLTTEPEITVVWTANRDDPPVSSNATLELTRDGKLLVLIDHQRGRGQENPIVKLEKPAVSASLLDSGNFVIYGNASEVIWASFDHPTDTILGGQNLTGRLVASASRSDQSSGKFFLSMQWDGNLVAYPINTSNRPSDSYWSSDTYGSLYLRLNDRGLLHLGSITVGNSSYPAGKNETVVHRATLDADGVFRLYAHIFSTKNRPSKLRLEWVALEHQCAVKGFCGFNSFCSSITNASSTNNGECICFPGFAPIDANETSQGCYRNFSDMEDCRNKELAQLYNISVLDHVSWGGIFYSSLSAVDQEICEKSCLGDCNCAAASYDNGLCKKFKLPLRYGSTNENYTATALIKQTVGISQTADGPSTVVDDKKKPLIVVLSVSLGSVALLCSLISMYMFFAYQRRLCKYRKLSAGSVAAAQGLSLRVFSYDELEKATDGFKEELGKGGAVFKGYISEDKRIVAVKKFERTGEEGEGEFRAEMTTTARTHHRNLVRLIGFCVDGLRKLLVYEHMGNGSLADLLFNVEKRPIWKERIRIALDVARGIFYLHEECEAHIIHCNIKPGNILMDGSWTAKISGFRLAKLLVPNQSTRITTSVRGTRGYVAPEWHRNAAISVKADVYSYGVLLLEIICCRSNMEVDVASADEVLLSTWVCKCLLSGQLRKLVGEEEGVDVSALERMVKVGLLCIQDDPNLRPSMKSVILMLEGTVNIPSPPFPAP